MDDSEKGQRIPFISRPCIIETQDNRKQPVFRLTGLHNTEQSIQDLIDFRCRERNRGLNLLNLVDVNLLHIIEVETARIYSILDDKKRTIFGEELLTPQEYILYQFGEIFFERGYGIDTVLQMRRDQEDPETLLESALKALSYAEFLKVSLDEDGNISQAGKIWNLKDDWDNNNYFNPFDFVYSGSVDFKEIMSNLPHFEQNISNPEELLLTLGSGDAFEIAYLLNYEPGKIVLLPGQFYIEYKYDRKGKQTGIFIRLKKLDQLKGWDNNETMMMKLIFKEC